ncbi:AfsR/SARP family transcriptional regulator [Glycomyces tenuis]|uniref:AfsR/SARP family transcriptional regulator n=1 Tax=Glycomyces tenuis TaxID=58116 RepID=UPI00041BCCF9|nr:BTAD domain-containing putative transcriptional regulator [Glycomyces tenuis]
MEVRSGDRVLPLRGPHQRRLLAVLLHESGRLVGIDRIERALWDDTPPETARQQVRNVVSGLRRALGAGRDRLRTVGQGYRLDVAAEELDLLRSRAHATEARHRREGSDLPGALESVRSALAEWRGPAFGGIGGLLVGGLAAELEEERLSLLEQRIALELDLGLHEGLTSELRRLVAEHPLRQPFTAQLMLALHRTGRTPEALTAYAELAERLGYALGVDPTPDLRELHTALLREDSGLDPARTEPAAIPAQLPAGIGGFTGRTEHLRRLDAMLKSEGEPLVALVTGAGGAGKTSLTVHWARQVAEHFPDGQLHVNLRGFDPQSKPLEPGDAARHFLEPLGVAPSRIPSDPQAQVELYRSLVANRRVLVVLDNARDAAQVRPLLPGGALAVTVVTSRNSLAGLAATHSARPVVLGQLSEGESMTLLENRLGKATVAANHSAVQRISRACGGLPLALAIAAARAATRPDFPLDALADELSADLDAFAGGDPAADLRTVFASSYRALDPESARVFRLLGLHPGPDYTVAAVASLAAIDRGKARRLLRALESAQLVREHEPGRYSCHDLVRTYTAELAHELDEDERASALDRMFDHYVRSAHDCALAIDPTRDPIEHAPPVPGVAHEEAEDRQAALAWFTAEYAVISALIRSAAATGFDVPAWRLAWAVVHFSDGCGHWREGIKLTELGVNAARRLGDFTGQAHLLRYLAQSYSRNGDHDRAFALMRETTALCADLDPVLSAHIDRTFAMMYHAQGRTAEALEHAHRALRTVESLGNGHGEAVMLNTVGWYLAASGEYDNALEYATRAYQASYRFDDVNHIANVADTIGYIHLHNGDAERSIGFFEESIERFEQLGDEKATAEALSRLGDAHLALGNLDAAAAVWRKAVGLVRAGISPQLHEELQDKLRRLQEG